MHRISVSALDAGESQNICLATTLEVASAYRDGDHEYVSRMLTSFFGTDAVLDSFADAVQSTGGDPNHVRDIVAQLLVGAAMVGAHARHLYSTGETDASEFPERIEAREQALEAQLAEPTLIGANPVEAILREIGMSIRDEDDSPLN